jgi:hypothetical protein
MIIDVFFLFFAVNLAAFMLLIIGLVFFGKQKKPRG